MGFSLKTVLLRLVQGFIIGAGGILPGISGGVLSVIFGIYRPVMEVLAHPLNGLRRHLSLLLPVGAGAILGFLCGGGLILVLFDRSEKLATCLFIGLILGTLPSLWAEAGAQGRGRGAYLSCAASFLALSAVLLYAQYGAFYTMRPGFLGFLFCGLLWGLSLIVPGMTSSSILMAVIPWRIAGEVLDTYIVCEDAEKTVWLIDKHAAHERVNFDRFKANLEPIMSQELLTPVVAQFAAAEYTALVGQLALLREFGFACEEFGDGAILIRALPADIPAEDAAASLEDLAGRLVETHHADPESARDALLHTMACKSAIKGGWKSDERELRVLVDKVQSGEVRFCPHGRPVAVKLTKYELEKMFKRA